MTPGKCHLTFLAMALSLGATAIHGAEPKRSPAVPPLSSGAGDKPAGAALRDRLLQQQPSETSINGLLKLRDTEGNRREIPVRIQTRLLAAGGWESTYETVAAPVERLVVRSTAAGERRYSLRKADGVTRELSASDVFHGFAGSNFTPADLGLQFLQWPKQAELARQLRRNRTCQVLESSTPAPAAAPGGYVRVRSWVDVETGGIIHADAYDAEGRQVKEFSLRSFKKVDERWQLREMEIIDLRSDSRTRLEFDLTLDAASDGR